MRAVHLTVCAPSPSAPSHHAHCVASSQQLPPDAYFIRMTQHRSVQMADRWCQVLWLDGDTEEGNLCDGVLADSIRLTRQVDHRLPLNSM